MCIKYMVPKAIKRSLKEIVKTLFPRVCSEDTSHDGCPESQVWAALRILCPSGAQ